MTIKESARGTLLRAYPQINGALISGLQVPSAREGEAASSEGLPRVPSDEQAENLVPLISVISPGSAGCSQGRNYCSMIPSTCALSCSLALSCDHSAPLCQCISIQCRRQSWVVIHDTVSTTASLLARTTIWGSLAQPRRHTHACFLPWKQPRSQISRCVWRLPACRAGTPLNSLV